MVEPLGFELELPLLLGVVLVSDDEPLLGVLGVLGELGELGVVLVSDELLEVLGVELGVFGVDGAFMSRRGSVSLRRPCGCVALLVLLVSVPLFLQAPTLAIIPAAEAKAIHLLRLMVVLSWRWP